ncbi:MAG: ATP-grasp domain-containing protein [Planctomycetaceae bacterium]
MSLTSNESDPRGYDNSDRTVILIGSSVRAAAADAKRGGYRVIAIDRYGDRDLLSSCDAWIPYDSGHRWLQHLAQLPPAPVVPVGGFHWDRDANGWIANADALRSRLVAFPAPKTYAQLHSPAWLGEVAAGLGIAFPETRYWSEGDLRTLFRPTIDSPLQTDQWLRKPWVHGGGVGISVACEDAIPTGEQYLQRRLRGMSIGANFVAYQQPGGPRAVPLGIFRGITYRRNPAHPFLYGGSVGPISLCLPVTSAIQRLGQAIAEQLPLVGLFNIDLMLGEKGDLALLEVNPRYSASMELIAIACGQPRSLIDWHLASYQNRPGVADEITTFQRETINHPAAKVACKRIVYASQAMIAPDLLAEAEPSRSGIEIRYCDLPPAKSAIAAGDPICTAIVSGPVELRQRVLSAAYERSSASRR